jgi:5-methylcytosine-specific restriction endonuclease McrA
MADKAMERRFTHEPCASRGTCYHALGARNQPREAKVRGGHNSGARPPSFKGRHHSLEFSKKQSERMFIKWAAAPQEDRDSARERISKTRANPQIEQRRLAALAESMIRPAYQEGAASRSRARWKSKRYASAQSKKISDGKRGLNLSVVSKRRRALKRKDPLRWKARNLGSAYQRLGHKDFGVEKVLASISDHMICPYCEDLILPLEISLDHIMPRSRGGTDELSNLHYTCFSCNLMKGNLTDAEFRALLVFLKQHTEMAKLIRTRLKAAGFMY